MSTVKVSTVEFRKNIYKWLGHLPLEVTSKGKTAFYVVAQMGTTLPEKKVKNISTIVAENKKLPMFCSKHKGTRVGLLFTCGCKV